MFDQFMLRFVTGQPTALGKQLRLLTGLSPMEGSHALSEGLIVREDQIGTLVINLNALVTSHNHKGQSEGAGFIPLTYEIKIEPYMPRPMPVQLKEFAV
jgi:hypothetical protein